MSKSKISGRTYCISNYCLQDAVDGQLCLDHGGHYNVASVVTAFEKGISRGLSGDASNMRNPYALHSEERNAWGEGAETAFKMLKEARIKIREELTNDYRYRFGG